MNFSKIPDDPKYTVKVDTWLKKEDYDFLCKLSEERQGENVLRKMIERELLSERLKRTVLKFDKNHLYTEIDPEKEFIDFDGIDSISVYVGWITQLVNVNEQLHWRDCDKETCDMLCIDAKCLTLNEIREQLQERLKDDAMFITVFVDSPLNGAILHYGNAGDKWVKLGEYAGYA